MQEEEAGMAVKQRRSATKADGTRAGSSIPADVIAAVGDIVAASQAAAAHVPKQTRRRIERLGRQFDAARATEAKRLRQSARLQQELAKRERQAADAAAMMASIVVTIRDAASGVAGAKAGVPKPTATKSASAKPATKAVTTKAVTTKAVPTKPAAATPATTKPAEAAQPATAAKAPTRRRGATTSRPKPTTRPRAASTRTTKPKPSA
jgi:hypothetical protein